MRSTRPEQRLRKSFALRLPQSTWRTAAEIAKQDGISLNQFIVLAVAEKVTRFEIQPQEKGGVSSVRRQAKESEGPFPRESE
jgi:hypothetical protein